MTNTPNEVIFIKRKVQEGGLYAPEPFREGEVLSRALSKHDRHKGNAVVIGFPDTNNGMVRLEAEVNCVMPGCRRSAVVKGSTR